MGSSHTVGDVAENKKMRWIRDKEDEIELLLFLTVRSFACQVSFIKIKTWENGGI